MRDPDWDYHCAEFAAAHVKEITGRDIWERFGGCPRNAREAAAVLHNLRVRTLKGAVTKLLGRWIDPKLAMRGDIVMVDNALGICRGDLAEFIDRMQPMSRAERAWKVRRRK